MISPSIPDNEKERLKALHDYNILDTISEKEFDDITLVVSEILNVPITLISLVDKDRQWFKSKVGLDTIETPRDISFCGHAILDSNNVFSVQDATKDERFHDNPLVTGDLSIRFYAGAPLVTNNGLVVGTLCTIDNKPREINEKQLKLLQTFASQVVAQLELRKTNAELKKMYSGTKRLFSLYENLALVAQKTHSAVMITNAAGEIEYANPSFEEMTGYQLEEVIGLKPGSFLQGKDTDPLHIQQMKEGLASLKPFNQEILNYRKNGEPYWLDCAISPVFDDKGELSKFVAVEQDVTINKKHEEELIAAKEEAINNERVKDQFLSNMSHEIRTPMNGIVGISNILLKNDDMGDANKEMVEYIHSSAKHLLKIINDILDFSKINAEKLEFEYIDFNIHEVLKTLRYALELKAEEKGISLNFSIDPEIADIHSGDPTRLTQILLNLISNALKFTEQGSVNLRAQQLCIDDRGTTIQFKVEDTGIGMNEEEMEKIFEKFSQSNRTITRMYGGTGLGLSIARNLIEKFNGDISVDSEPGQGTTFTFTIQLLHPTGVKKQEKIVFQNVFSEEEKANIKILLAEDNKLNQIVARKHLKHFGFGVDIVDNGKEALESIKSNQYDLVLMDVNMPVMNGLEATQAIRNLPSQKNTIKIAALTASVLKRDIQNCIDSGMDDFIAKPFEPEAFYQKIIDLLTEQREDEASCYS